MAGHTMRRLEVPGPVADRAQGFVGRRSTLEKVAAWLKAPPEGNRFLVVTGEPGSGKSAFMGWLAGAGPDPADPHNAALRRMVNEALDAVHFCVAASGGASASQNPYEFGRHLAMQFAAADPGYARDLARALGVEVHGDARAQVNYGKVIGVQIGTVNIADPVSLYLMTCTPLRSICEADPSRQFVILVDALDEAELATATTTIGQLIADSLEFPPGIRFLVSSRDVHVVIKRFPPDACWDIVKDASADRPDLAKYVLDRCSSASTPPDDLLIAQVIDASDGNFLYAKTVLDFWLPRLGQMSWPIRLALPPKLDGIYAEFLQREYGDSPKWRQMSRPLLATLGVAQEPLDRVQLRFILEAEADALQDALQLCQPYLDGQRPAGPFELYHRSFRDFLFDAERNTGYPVNVHDAHARVAQRYTTRYSGAWDTCHDEYGLRYSPTHLAQAATTDAAWLRPNYVEELLALLGDETFQAAHQARLNDPVALKADLETAVQRSCEGQGERAVGQLLAALSQLEQFRTRQFNATRAFELAEQGQVRAAERHIAWFRLERRWDQMARLIISWLGMNADRAAALELLERVGTEEVDDPLVSAVRELVEYAFSRAPRPWSPPLPQTGEQTVQQILNRMAGTGGEVRPLLSEVQNPSALVAFTVGIDPHVMATGGSAYLGAVDGPYLVGFAALTPAGDQYVEDYLTLQARNSYAFYRTRSLWALIPSILAHPDVRWIRRFLRRLVESALAPSPAHFDEQVPLAAAALDVAAGRPGAAAAWQHYQMQAMATAGDIQGSQPSNYGMREGSGDRWGRHKRRMCALAEATGIGLNDPQRAWEMVGMALALPYGFAGFESPACLTLAETAYILRPDDRATTRTALRMAGASAHRCQDPAYCARTTSRFNALALRWWRIDEPEPQPFDVEAVINRFVTEPHAPDFSAVHVVGERYEGRQPPPVHLPFDDRAIKANCLRDLASLYERPLDNFLRLNRQLGAGPGTQLAAGTPVNVPDDDLAPQLATFLSAQVLATPGLSRLTRAQLIQSLIPIAVADRTVTDTLVARLLLASPPTSESVRNRLPRTLPEIG